MDPSSSRRITKNIVFIKENITQLGKVMDKLIESGNISMDEKADVLTEKGLDTQCHIILDTLMKRGGNAFQSFIEALKMSGNDHVADRLLHTDVSLEEGIQVNREDTVEIDQHQDEIIKLIRERELFRMKYDKLKSKYKILQEENENKTEEMQSMEKEMETLKDRLTKNEKNASQIESVKVIHRRENKSIKTAQVENKVVVNEDLVDGSGISEILNTEEKAAELVSKLEHQTMTIGQLTKENIFYSCQMKVLEDQIEVLKTDIEDKDDKIMKMRNSMGKLQTYIDAGKKEREKLTTELQQQMERNQMENEKRFDKVDEKLNLILKAMTSSRNTQKPADVVTLQLSPRNASKQQKYNRKSNGR